MNGLVPKFAAPSISLSISLGLLAVVGSAMRLEAQQPGRVDTLPELVTTATRLPTPPTGVVATRTVIRGEDLRARGVRFVADALRDIPAAAVVPASAAPGAQTSLFLRGGNSDYVKVLVDGVPLNQPGGLFDFANLTTDNLDRIEIVRGPASVLYGADAVTGVVQLFTRTGDGRLTGELRALGGSFGSTEFAGSASGGAAGGGWSASLSRQSSNGTYDFNNDYRNTVGSARLAMPLSPSFKLALTGRVTDARYEFPTNGSGFAVDSNQFSTERQIALGVDAGYRVGPRTELRLFVGGTSVRTGFENDSDSPGDTSGFGFIAANRSLILRGNVDARVIVRPRSGLDLVGGFAVEREAEDLINASTSNFGGGAFSDQVSYDSSRTTLSPYVQAVADLPSGFALNAGARLDDNSRFGDFFTYRAALAWQSRSGTRLRAAIGSAFKAPKFREQFIQTPFEIGNPGLEPERSTTWELGIEQAIAGSALAVGVTYFDSRFRDLIQYQFIDDVTPTYFNLAEAESRGVEAEVTASPTPALRLIASYTWLKTEVVDAGASASVSFQEGEPLLRRPANTARLGVLYRLAGRVTLGTNVNYIGKRDDVDFSAFPAVRVELEDYALTELTADADILEGGAGRPTLGVTLRVENVFQASYEPVLGFPGRERAVFAGARVGF